MLSGMFKTAFSKIFGGDVDYVNDSISAYLIDTSVYAPDLDSDNDVDDIPESSILSETQLTGKFISGVELHADPLVFPSVPASTLTGSGIVVFVNADTVSNSHLLFLYEGDLADEFPVTPDGTDIPVNWVAGGLLNGIL